MTRTIRVTGKGTINVSPDTTVLTIKTDCFSSDYETLIQNASFELERLKETIAKQGFKKEDLKTKDFDINTEYSSVKDKKGNYKSVFSGYRYRRKMKLSFPKDNERLGKLMQALSTCGIDPDLSLNFIVSDTESTKNLLLEKAVEDGYIKAEALSRGAGVKLGQLLSIDYSWGVIHLETEYIDLSAEKCYCFSEGIPDFDVEPEDVSASDTVTLVYEIIG